MTGKSVKPGGRSIRGRMAPKLGAGTALTDREAQVALRVTAGVTTKRIAAELGISPRRVRGLIASIAYRIGADPSRDERTQIATWWRAQGYTDAA